MYFYFKYTVNHFYEILNKNVVNMLTSVILLNNSDKAVNGYFDC